MTIRFVVDSVDGVDSDAVSATSASTAARPDHLVRARFPDVDRDFALKLLKSGRISVDGITASLKSRAENGATVTIDIADGRLGAPRFIPYTVLHRARGLIVVDKAAGVAMHEGPGVGVNNPDVDHDGDDDGNDSGDVPLSIRLARDSVEAGELVDANFPAFLGRLDRPTSGLVVAALTLRALHQVEPSWRQGDIRKEYLVAVTGHTDDRGMIDVPLAGRRPHQRGTGVIDEARTGYTTIARSTARIPGHKSGISIIVAELFTGRTHQIRRHLKAIGHALVGDPRYGARDDDGSTGLLLHAWRIRQNTRSTSWPSALLPTSIEAPWPSRITAVMIAAGIDVPAALVSARALP